MCLAFERLRLPLLALAAVCALLPAQAAKPLACAKPLYLTLDTGHMGVAPLVADVLKRQQVRATFFLASEPTQDGGSSLDEHWAAWWRARAAEGHDFGSHTWHHDAWQADLPDGSFRLRRAAGQQTPQTVTLSAQAYCEALRAPAKRFEQMTGRPMAPIFRAPAGRTSPALLAAAQACGFKHVGWSDAGFLGDELPTARASNAQLLQRSLKRIRSGDILMAHLGIWSRQPAWAPEVLEPLIVGLKAQGFCFAPLREHPDYAAWMQQPLRTATTVSKE
ncbi:polysaccharide deacetylase family protein [Roseateles sp. BYS180W]|uniref:Polysaccharide deacetylase family protein n=1 Tax=Roseateles rivi TaxID=3299028 RepID=A0ABW7FW07_9BURK